MKFRIFLLLLFFLSPPAQAGSELLTLIKMLHANGTVSDEQYQRLLDEIKSGAAQQEQLAQKVAEKEADTIKLKLNKGGLQAKTSDGQFSAKIGGRVQADAAWYNEDSSEMGNGSKIRRARLYISGNMFYDWGYKLQYDFTSTGKAGIKDAYLSYNGLEHISLTGGHFKDPFLLQEQTSSKHTTFMERAMPSAFAADRHLGFMVSSAHKHWTAAVGLFGNKITAKNDGKDHGWGAGGRLTLAPINEKTKLIHVGIAANYRNKGDSESVRFKQQAETNISGVNTVDTGTITGVNQLLKLGAELAAVHGPFSFQSEYLWTQVERESLEDLEFDGWYVQAGYFITGESRKYKKGKFSGIKPKNAFGNNGGYGAWQIAARYSTLDLTDKDINGGEAQAFAVGINWFPVSTLRFSGNYVKVLDVDGGAHDGEEPGLIQIRGQWAF